MNNKAGSRDLDDADIIDADDEIDLIVPSDDEVNLKPTTTVKTENIQQRQLTTPVAHRPPNDRARSAHGRNTSHNVLMNISEVLDPHAHAVRREEQSISALQNQQIFSLSSQFRDAQRQLDTLRIQLTDAERRADCAEMHRMIARSHIHSPHSDIIKSPHSSHRRSASRSHRPRFRQVIHCGDGGRSTTGWIDPSDEDVVNDHASIMIAPTPVVIPIMIPK